MESNGRDGSLSPDLLMHLPTSELSATVTNEESSVSALSGQSSSERCPSQSAEETHPHPSTTSPPPDLIITQEINLNGNMNNNNNNGSHVMVVERAAIPFTPGSTTHTFAHFNSHHIDSSMISTNNIKYSSMESGFEADNEQDSYPWYLSPAPSPVHPSSSTSINANKSDRFDYDHLPQSSMASPKVLFSPSSTTSQSHSSSDTISPHPWPSGFNGGPLSPTSLYPVGHPSPQPRILPPQQVRQLVSSYPRNAAAYRASTGSRHRRHFSEPDKNFARHGYHRPLLRPHYTQTSTTSASRYQQRSRRSSCGEQPAFSREREFAVEHELQTVQKAEVIFSDPYFYSDPRRQQPPHANTENLSSMRRQRRINSEVIYTSDDNSGRNTPENFQFKSKVHVNVQYVKIVPMTCVLAIPVRNEHSYWQNHLSVFDQQQWFDVTCTLESKTES